MKSSENGIAKKIRSLVEVVKKLDIQFIDLFFSMELFTPFFTMMFALRNLTTIKSERSSFRIFSMSDNGTIFNL